jgi:predicted RNase H-like HicB family nuclease
MSLANYIRAAMAEAVYQVDPEDGLVHGEIPGFAQIQAEGRTLLECRHALIELLEDWIDFHLARGLEVPSVNGIGLQPGLDL